MRKPWQLKARSIFLLFADGWVSSCPAGEQDSGLAGLARSIAKRESQPMALKPEIRICSGRIYHIIAYLFCPVLSRCLCRGWPSVWPSVCPVWLLGCICRKLPRRVHNPTQPNQLVTQFQSTINRIHIASQSMKPALTNVNDGSSDARRPATFAGTFGARSPSGLHGVWGALITNGSHHDLAIITGAPQQDPAKTTRSAANFRQTQLAAFHGKVTVAVEGKEMSKADD